MQKFFLKFLQTGLLALSKYEETVLLWWPYFILRCGLFTVFLTRHPMPHVSAEYDVCRQIFDKNYHKQTAKTLHEVFAPVFSTGHTQTGIHRGGGRTKHGGG